MSKRPTVSVEVAQLIDQLHAALVGEFGHNFQYHITGLDRTVAAANTERAQGLPGHRIHPKIRKKPRPNEDQEDEPPQAEPLH